MPNSFPPNSNAWRLAWHAAAAATECEAARRAHVPSDDANVPSPKKRRLDPYRYVQSRHGLGSSHFKWPGEYTVWLDGGSFLVVPPEGKSRAFGGDCFGRDAHAQAALDAVISLPSKSSTVFHCRDQLAVDFLRDNAKALFEAEAQESVLIKDRRARDVWLGIPEAIRRRRGLTITAILCGHEECEEVFGWLEAKRHQKAKAAKAKVRAAKAVKGQFHPSAAPRDYATLGGRNHYEAAREWAGSFYTPDERRIFNKALAEGGDRAFLATKALVLRFERETCGVREGGDWGY